MQSDADKEGGSAEGSADDEDGPPHTPKRKRSANDILLGKTFKNTRSSQTMLSHTSIVEKEVKLYRDSPSLPLSCGPLGWWRSQAYRYPLLAKLAQRYLCVPGTSVPPERIFSPVCDNITPQRSTVTTEHADQLVFLKKNMP